LNLEYNLFHHCKSYVEMLIFIRFRVYLYFISTVRIVKNDQMIQIDNVIPLGLVMPQWPHTQKIKLKKTKGIDSPVQQTTTCICKIFIIYIHDIKQYPWQWRASIVHLIINGLKIPQKYCIDITEKQLLKANSMCLEVLLSEKKNF
jgi:hypothetical protein